MSVASSTSPDRQPRRTDVRKNSVDRMVGLLPADDWQQNEDVALKQSQRLEHSEQPDTKERYRSDSTQFTYTPEGGRLS